MGRLFAVCIIWQHWIEPVLQPLAPDPELCGTGAGVAAARTASAETAEAVVKSLANMTMMRIREGVGCAER